MSGTDTENDAASGILIVGAGPTGLTLAAGLLRRDVPVRIVDRAERANPHSKAIILWPRGLEVFARLGVEDEIRRRAVPIMAANYHAGGSRVCRVNFRGLRGSRFDGPLSLPQNETEDVLEDLVDRLGGTVDRGCGFVSATQDDQRVMTALTSGEIHTSRWLVGCDGYRSAVRETCGISFDGEPYPQRFALVDGMWSTSLAIDESHYFMGDSGVLVVVGLPGDRMRVFVSLPAGTGAAGTDDLVPLVQQIARERCPAALDLVESTGNGVFTVSRRMARSFAQGRILLAGDAAHVHSPAGGQGLNTSVQDAHEVAWRLAEIHHGSLDASALASWESERMHVARIVVADTDRQTRLWSQRGWRRRLRDALARSADRSGLLDRYLPGRLAQLDLDYPTPNVGLGRVAPGRRLPDLEVAPGVRAHDLLRDGGTVALLCSDRSQQPGPDLVAACRDVRARIIPVRSGSRWTVRRPLGLRRPALLLVRPDGVVAAAGTLRDRALSGRIRAALPGPGARRDPAPFRDQA
jgi:2-polyprenyl-6-methoxyphenol hydroxylase-like FAD-dependent oxidoreductase